MGLKPGDRQLSMLIPNVEELVSAEHRYGKLLHVVDWVELARPLRELYSNLGRRGYSVETAVKCLFLQFLVDRSDREMERLLQDSLAAKYFCNFGLTDQTPDHSFFGTFRQKVGIERLSELFQRLTQAFKKRGLVREVYTFVDSSKIVAAVDSWRARDKALEDPENEQRDDDGNPTMNNQNLERYSSDPDARYGVKGKRNPVPRLT